ncbi:nucleoside recognition membrane protein YjiH [Caldalkalibacillus uzonensis]|uniref:Nucleoside recognition membrane protein YjiH n=1 Tax=Caldalkalibacillus uzonensis TaxID=353224 RepID=A0ABU0CV88_9BACI|nr:YjiH family protein [Caldalkalibacillus uzonensis]MDQ0340008.1 nucleoside recognition membrane protein YjiH [Caldalkalibacillus uzonensis]
MAMNEMNVGQEHKPLQPAQQTARLKFWITFLLGMFFFLIPLKVSGNWTIAFDVVVSWIRTNAPGLVALYCLLIICISALLSVLAVLQQQQKIRLSMDLSYFATKPAFLGFRVLGAVFAALIYFTIGPDWFLSPGAGGLMFNTLVASVAMIVPIGAIFITLFVAFGGLEFIGTLARPLMRPLFKVPGRSALDAVASFVGSYSVGIYVTNKMYLQGRYSAREATIIATCFSTVSIGFFAVVANTLELLGHFPLIFFSTLLVSAILAFILVRIPPLSRLPDEYVGEPKPEEERTEQSILKQAVEAGVKQAAQSSAVHKELAQGFVDGLKLSMVILPSILSIGLLAILLANHTPLFTWLGKPMEPLLALLGLPDVHILAPATLIGITEMFLPALLVTEAAVAGKFFIAVLSLSQILFFSAVIPLLLEVDIPIKLRHILVLFVLRTLIAMPIIAAITHLFF